MSPCEPVAQFADNRHRGQHHPIPHRVSPCEPVADNDGNLLAQNEEVSTGANVSLDVQATWGWNQYKVVAANEQGEGYPVHIRKFVGPDKPKAPQNLQATWGEESNELLLSV